MQVHLIRSASLEKRNSFGNVCAGNRLPKIYILATNYFQGEAAQCKNESRNGGLKISRFEASDPFVAEGKISVPNIDSFEL